ncbi:MAG TPA: hypothetical protein VHH73_20240 [Verrucomicrobiae bacterium]|nr:hypothetical protein [Verrucomicrobiae bacterium]
MSASQENDRPATAALAHYAALPTGVVFAITACERVEVRCPHALPAHLRQAGSPVTVNFAAGDFQVDLTLRDARGKEFTLRFTAPIPLHHLDCALRAASQGAKHYLQRHSPLPPAPVGGRSPATRSCSTRPEPGKLPAAAGGNSPRSQATGVIPGAAHGPTTKKTKSSPARRAG